MKSKKLFLIIGILVIPVIMLILLFALKVCQIYIDEFDRISIMYLVEKDTYQNIYIKKHSLVKFSKLKKGMNLDEVYELVGKPTNTEDALGIWYRYKLNDGWYINLQFVEGLHHIEIANYVKYPNGRVFKLEYDEYTATPSYLSACAQIGGSRNTQKLSFDNFAKIKIGMNPAEVVKLAGKPIDSVDSSFIWYRYKIDTGWYIDLHFFNEQLSDISIVDSPNNRVFELQQDEYITTLPCPNTVAQSGSNNGTGTFTDDRDGKTYRTVKIGKLTWMAENLNFVTDSSVCYKNADSNCTKYGRLYNWDAAAKACPAGWRLSSDEDWVNLALAVAGKCNGRIHWNLAGKKLKSKIGWSDFSGNGTDDYEFSALPGGVQFHSSRNQVSMFYSVGHDGNWWSARDSDTTRAGSWNMFRDYLYWDSDNKLDMRSVRCVCE